MTKPEKKALVPALRFPEFRDMEGWEETTIGGIGSFYYGKSAPKWSLEENSPTPCVRYGELYTKFGAVITETYSRTNIDPNNLRFSKGGEILVPRVGEKPEDFGKCCCYLTLKNIAIGEMISVFETAQNPLFYTYYFRHLYREFAKVVEGQNVKNLYYVELEPLPICRPTSPEQQKIADCLSSLDDLITSQTQKLAALKAHKKGLMQQLFPAEGETVPKLRFPEFRDEGEWQEKRLENFAVIVRGGSPRPIDEYITKDVNSLNWLKIGDIDKESKYVTHTQEKVIFAALNKTRVVNPGDLILSNSMSFGRPYILKIKTCIHDGWIAVSEIDNDLDRDYLYYFMMTSVSQVYFSNNAAGSGVQNLNVDIIKLLPIFYPDKKEQQKIADCLSSVDELITAPLLWRGGQRSWTGWFSPHNRTR